MNQAQPGHKKLDLLALLSILVLIAAKFWRTIFLGDSISKVDMIAHWDSIFHGLKASSAVGIEEGTVLFMPPYRFLVAHLWRSGEIPLWNSYSGLGCPLLGDPQSIAFSPLLLPLILSPDIYTYNIWLIMQVYILAAGAYLLARQIGLGFIASIFASLAAAFCPYMQWYLELLGTGYCLVPLLFFSFARLAIRPTHLNVLFAGTSAATIVLSGHPETSFCAVTTASLLMLVVMIARCEACSWRVASDYIKYILAAGVTALVIAAPMLLPAIEFLTHSESYKFGGGNPSYIGWQTLVLNLVQPLNGPASPFIGSCSIFLLILAWFRKDKRMVFALVFLEIILICLVAKLFPLGLIYSMKPFNYIVATYWTPGMLTIAIILAAIGLDNLWSLTRSTSIPLTAWILIVISILAPIAMRPLLLAINFPFNSLSFDMAMPAAAPARDLWQNQSIAAAICLLAVLLAAVKHGNRKVRRVVSLIVLTISFMTQLLSSHQSLSARQNFDFPKTAPLDFLKEEGKRFLATGTHLVKPNINLIYCLRDYRCLNAIFPERFLQFSSQAHATVTDFKVEYDLPISKMLRLAGVKYILSDSPVFSEELLESSNAIETEFSPPITFSGNGQLLKIKHKYCPDLAGIIGVISFKPAEKDLGIKFQTVLLNASNWGALFWSDLKPIPTTEKKGEKSIQEYVSIPTNLRLPEGTELAYGLRFYNSGENSYLTPNSKLQKVENTIILDKFKTKRSESQNQEFQLHRETDRGIRCYENLLASEDVYVVHKTILVENGKEALEWINSERFDPKIAVLENSDEVSKSICLNIDKDGVNKNQNGTDRISYNREKQGRIEIETDTQSEGILVVNEILYPGWEAYIDGRRVPIVHANFAFKAIALPKGNHEVIFQYAPVSFKAGVIIFLLGLALTCSKLLKSMVKGTRKLLT